MKRSRFSDEHIAFVMRQVKDGAPVVDIYRQTGLSEAALYIRRGPLTS